MMKHTTKFACIVTMSFLATALFLVPSASADPTTVCPLETAPPCASVTPSATTGDGDCDSSNGAGSVNHQVDAWTGAYPVGNSSAQALNQCGAYAGYTAAYVTVYTPADRYPTKWVGFYWIQHAGGCYAGVYTGGRGGGIAGQNVFQDLGPVVCPLGAPPTLPS